MPAILTPRRTNVSPIGVDIGSSSARAVQLCRQDGGWTLRAAASWQVQGGNDLAGRAEFAAQRIRRALRQREFLRRSVVVGLTQPDLELHALEMPAKGDAQDQQKLGAAARWEIGRLCSFDDEDIQAAHWWLPKPRGTGTTALGVGVPRETVKKVWQAWKRCGAECRRVDASACALYRAGLVLCPPKSDQVWGVLDLGARSSRLVLGVDQVPTLARVLKGGGDDLTARVAGALQVSTDSAQMHKCDHGICPSPSRAAGGYGVRAVKGQPAPLSELAAMVFAALRQELERISAEIIRSYEYTLQCYPGRNAGHLILAGGGAAMKGLDQYLAGKLGIPVRRADEFAEGPACRLHVAQGCGRLREPLGALMTAIGLAIDPEDEL